MISSSESLLASMSTLLVCALLVTSGQAAPVGSGAEVGPKEVGSGGAVSMTLEEEAAVAREIVRELFANLEATRQLRQQQQQPQEPVDENMRELALTLARKASAYPVFGASKFGGRSQAKRAGMLSQLIAEVFQSVRSTKRKIFQTAAMGVDLPDYILHLNKGRNFDFSQFREKLQKSG